MTRLSQIQFGSMFIVPQARHVTCDRRWSGSIPIAPENGINLPYRKSDKKWKKPSIISFHFVICIHANFVYDYIFGHILIAFIVIRRTVGHHSLVSLNQFIPIRIFNGIFAIFCPRHGYLLGNSSAVAAATLNSNRSAKVSYSIQKSSQIQRLCFGTAMDVDPPYRIPVDVWNFP